MAIRFAAEGARVIAADWNAQRLEEVVTTIMATDGVVVSAQGNIANQATAEGLIDLATETFGRLDILCNNAGVMDYMQGVGELSDEVWHRVLGINLDGPMFATRRAIQVMLQQGSGSIINTASTAGIEGGAAGAAYTASKHGLVGLTREMALELGERGIRVNAVAPGVVRTPLTERYFQDPAYAQAIRDIHALGRWAEPQEIARAILFLADEANGFITGAVLTVDGGWTIGKKM